MGDLFLRKSNDIIIGDSPSFTSITVIYFPSRAERIPQFRDKLPFWRIINSGILPLLNIISSG
jgi:hypothetical protein